MKKYFIDIAQGIASVWQGLKLTLRHLLNARKMHTPTYVSDSTYFLQDTGIVTLQYPFEKLPIPDHGRYKLHNEIDDCIVCDKCAVICPVNCIAIETIKSAEPIGETSDGSVKRLYAPVFDIDMAKCCFCGLCTSVCPTECLTMTNTYDFSTYKVEDLNVSFANMTPELATEKRTLYNQYVKEKEELKVNKLEISTTEVGESAPKPIIKPAFKPVIKPIATSVPNDATTVNSSEEVKKPAAIKPVFKPVIKPKSEIVSENLDEAKSESKPVEIKKPIGLKPVIKPVIKKPDVPPPTE